MKTLKVLGTMLALALSIGLAPVSVAGATTPQPSVLSNKLDKTEITYGGKVSLEAVLTVNSVAVSGVTVNLYRREYPATEFSFVTSAVTNDSGKAVVANLLPAKKTNYKWVFSGSETAAPSESPWQTVRVHTEVTMRLSDGTISPGQRFVARGLTSPNKAGAPVVMWRVRAGGQSEKWFSGTVGDDGRYRLSKRVPSTLAYRLFVVVPARSGNLNGTSQTEWLIVS